MTETVTGGPEAPRPKAAMPPLDTRAPRPSMVRLRRGVLVGVVMAGMGLVGGSLAWAFVVQPDLRARAHDARLEGRPTETRGTVRPSEKVTDAPASYGDLNRLPEPRELGREPTPANTPAPARARQASRPSRGGLASDARGSGLFFASPAARSSAPAAGDSADTDRSDLAAVYNTHALQASISPYEVKAGAVIAAALLTAIDTARSGPVTATVTENVFDTVSGRFLLIPQGARLIGRHEGESRHGDRRAFVAWERLILPNGKSLILPKEPGVDATGAIGVRGAVDRRLGSLAIATLFAGAITTLGQVARDH
ncbi:TrbI/VirB10 family protein, partial [uncultured Phenylobacterium sp.]|uniref:TrbI/VirB10 family protein n=1 Tax=uncultured Phenylobacterium sp. TaxID=349273 RepID=UPI0025DC0505